MDIIANINGQIIKAAKEYKVVADSVDFLYMKFKFPEDWRDVSKTAIFTYGETVKEMLLSDDQCKVPAEVIKAPGFTVSVFGTGTVNSSKMATANEMEIPVEKSGLKNGEPPSEPTPTIYAQLVQTVTAERTAAESAAINAVENANQTVADRLVVEGKAAQVVADAGQVSADKLVVEQGVQIVQSAADAETGRVNAENLRAAAESGRTDAEVTRVQAEVLRDIAEIVRDELETLRKSAESSRDAAETIRKANEVARQAALDLKANQSTTYTKTESNAALALKADKVQEAWITPTLLNGWLIFTASNPVGYFKDSMGFVHFKGAVKSGTLQTNIFVLPAGYRPSNYSMLFASFSNGSIGSITVKTDGTVQLYSGNNAYVYLDNVIFRAEV